MANFAEAYDTWRNTTPQTVKKSKPEGTANYYDDSYGPLLQFLLQSGLGDAPGAGGLMTNVLQNFKGDQRDLRRFLEEAAPFLAASMEGTPAFKALQDFGAASDFTQAYGAGAGKIAAAGQRSVRQGEEALGSAGLGRSAASASLASGAALNTGTEQADLFTRLRQGSLQARQQGASQAFDAHRMISQIAVGANPQVRQSDTSNPWMALAGAGVGAAGNVLGSLVGGG